jgi:hypothetical protein
VAEDDEKQAGRDAESAPPAKTDREARLAAALRANLRRRKVKPEPKQG